MEPLTDNQQRILALIATGMSNKQVADKLFITVGTTKWHVNQIFGRLQVRNRTEARRVGTPVCTFLASRWHISCEVMHHALARSIESSSRWCPHTAGGHSHNAPATTTLSSDPPRPRRSPKP